MDDEEKMQIMVVLQQLQLMFAMCVTSANTLGNWANLMLKDDDDDDTSNQTRRLLIKSKVFREDVFRMDTKQFRRSFRIHYETFIELTRYIFDLALTHGISELVHIEGSGGRHLDLHIQMLILIWYLSHGQETLNSIAERFGVCETTVHRVRKRLCKVIAIHLSRKVISWPNTAQAVNAIQMGFSGHGKLNNVMGAIDSTHIKIRPPTDYPETYVNRKAFHSINLQLVVDSSLCILDIHTGHPGSVHDARVFKESPLGQMLTGNHATWNPDLICPGNTYLIGDAAYPILPKVITPFKNVGPNFPERERFNFIHSSTRMAVERAIGLLKGRMKRLMYGIDVWNVEEILHVITAACCIHQVALKCDDESDVEELFQETLTSHQNAAEIQNLPGNDDQSHDAGDARRHEIMVELGLLN